MTSKNLSQKSKKYKVGLQHMLLVLALFVTFFWMFFYTVMPNMIAAFVLPLFKPSQELQTKIGFVKFQGLVWASTAKENASQASGKEITAKMNNKEYIFDFTFHVRNEEEHGYFKASNEWFAKAPVLGEEAIYLEPYVGFAFLAAVASIVLTLILTMFMPSSIGLMAVLFDKQIDDTKIKLRVQTGFNDEIIELLIMPDDKLQEKDVAEVRSAFRIVWDRTMTEDMANPFQSIRFDDNFNDDSDILFFRNTYLYDKIKEFFSEFVVKEIKDIKNALIWRRNRLQTPKGFRLYMAHHFTEKYSNVVTGMAYGGAAFLIVAVGIRGLKFIPATRPSFILLAIGLEFTLLALMALTLIYTEEEERMDKMLKKMEDANRSQLEALRSQQVDIHQLANALVGNTAEIIRTRVETAIEEYMTSGDQVQRAIAEEISKKLLFTLKDENHQNRQKHYGGETRR